MACSLEDKKTKHQMAVVLDCKAETAQQYILDERAGVLLRKLHDKVYLLRFCIMQFKSRISEMALVATMYCAMAKCVRSFRMGRQVSISYK